jgi:hypothetical protein
MHRAGTLWHCCGEPAHDRLMNQLATSRMQAGAKDVLCAHQRIEEGLTRKLTRWKLACMKVCRSHATVEIVQQVIQSVTSGYVLAHEVTEATCSRGLNNRLHGCYAIRKPHGWVDSATDESHLVQPGAPINGFTNWWLGHFNSAKEAPCLRGKVRR